MPNQLLYVQLIIVNSNYYIKQVLSYVSPKGERMEVRFGLGM